MRRIENRKGSEKMTKSRMALLLTVALLAMLVAPAVAGAQEQVTIGVSIPAATHGWTGGVNYWARETQRRLQETYPNLRIVLVTANDASSQVNDIEDLYAIHNIDALVILPFESDPITDPVEHLKNLG